MTFSGRFRRAKHLTNGDLTCKRLMLRLLDPHLCSRNFDCSLLTRIFDGCSFRVLVTIVKSVVEKWDRIRKEKFEALYPLFISREVNAMNNTTYFKTSFRNRNLKRRTKQKSKAVRLAGPRTSKWGE